MNFVRTSLFVLLAAAAFPLAAEDDFAFVEERIRGLAPNAETVAISETPIEGILMIQVDGEIIYASADGRYLIQGRLMDMETREDLTEAAKSGLRKDILSTLDSPEPIVFAPEEPDYDLLVFTDIDCGYCRKLHAQIEEYNQAGIAIRYMAFPRAGIGSRSYEKAVSVWCADDQQSAMTLAKTGSDPDPMQCDNPVADQYQLGRQLGVTGTPALLTPDGQLIPGYVPPEQLRERLEKMVASSAAE